MVMLMMFCSGTPIVAASGTDLARSRLLDAVNVVGNPCMLLGTVQAAVPDPFFLDNFSHNVLFVCMLCLCLFAPNFFQCLPDLCSD